MQSFESVKSSGFSVFKYTLLGSVKFVKLLPNGNKQTLRVKPERLETKIRTSINFVFIEA
jgi:hypothetical protein